MTATLRSAGAVLGLGVLVLANAGCGRDVIPTSHGLHGSAIRNKAYNHLAFSQRVTITGSKSSSWTAFALAPHAAAQSSSWTALALAPHAAAQSSLWTALAPHAAAPTAEVVDVPRAMHHVTRVSSPVEVVDVPRAVRDVERIPDELAQLRRLLMYGALGVLVCGGLNAALLTAILGALLRRPARQTGALPDTEELSVPARHCRCGATISEHSRTGRCRRCALTHNRRLAAAQGAPHSLPAS